MKKHIPSIVFIISLSALFHYWFIEYSKEYDVGNTQIITWSSITIDERMYWWDPKDRVHKKEYIQTKMVDWKVNYLSFYLDDPYFVYNIKFKKSFIDKYKYENSDNFCFAVNIQANWKWWYLDTFRNKNGWVSNDSKIEVMDWILRLQWCYPASSFVWSGIYRSFEWKRLNAFANKDTYWFHKDILWTGEYKLYMSTVKETSRDNIFDVEIYR